MATHYTITEKFEIDLETEAKIRSFFESFSQSLIETVKDMDAKDIVEKLDYSPKSLTYLDEIADEWINSSEMSENLRFNLIRVLGGYLCRTIDRNFCGHWVKYENETLFIFYSGEQQSSLAIPPYEYAVRRVDDGEAFEEQLGDLSPLINKSSIRRPISDTTSQQ